MEFEMKPVPADAKRGWTITADGVIIRPRKLTLESRFGVWTYGVRPEGYDSIVIGEAAGGGAATLPYSYAPDGRLLVGLVMENRPNMGDEPTPCLMGGFVKLGEKQFRTLCESKDFWLYLVDVSGDKPAVLEFARDEILPRIRTYVHFDFQFSKSLLTSKCTKS